MYISVCRLKENAMHFKTYFDTDNNVMFWVLCLHQQIWTSHDDTCMLCTGNQNCHGGSLAVTGDNAGCYSDNQRCRQYGINAYRKYFKQENFRYQQIYESEINFLISAMSKLRAPDLVLFGILTEMGPTGLKDIWWWWLIKPQADYKTCHVIYKWISGTPPSLHMHGVRLTHTHTHKQMEIMFSDISPVERKRIH